MESDLGRPLTDDERGKLRTVLKRMFGDIFSETAFERELMPVVAKHLTEDEANEASNFYRGPLGSKLIRLTPVLATEATAVADRLVKANEQVLDRFEAEFDKEFPGLLRAKANEKWSTFSSKAGRFTVLMPGSPQARDQVANTVVGPITLHAFSVEIKRRAAAYYVSYADYPEKLVRESSPKDLLDGARDGAVANVGGALLSERILSLDGNPGRQLTIEVPGGSICQSRVYLVHWRIYQVAALTRREDRFSSNVGEFLDSLRLLRK